MAHAHFSTITVADDQLTAPCGWAVIECGSAVVVAVRQSALDTAPARILSEVETALRRVATYPPLPRQRRPAVAACALAGVPRRIEQRDSA